MFNPSIWWQAFADAGVDVDRVLHASFELTDRLPWDHLNVKKGRTFLEKEHNRATVQLAELATVG